MGLLSECRAGGAPMVYQELQGAAAPCGRSPNAAASHHIYVACSSCKAATTARLPQRLQFALSLVLCLVVLPGLVLALIGLFGTAVSCTVASRQRGGSSADACLWRAITHFDGLSASAASWRLPVPPDEKRVYSSHCIRAIGGGTVGPRGNFVHPAAECEAELREYLDGGAYDFEVAEVADAAIAYFSALLAAGPGASAASDAPKPLVVFDIDETALSNRATFFPFGARCGAALSSLGRHGCGHGAPAAASSSSVSSSSSSSSSSSAVTGEQARRLQQEYAPLVRNESSRTTPALLPVLRLYQALHASGYGVAFLTGRSEAARDATADNLAAVGYGRPCVAAAPAGGQFGSKQAALAGGAAATSSSSSSSSSGGSGGSSGAAKEPEAPCYVSLLLREDGDVRLASVYKPAKRAELEAAGYAITGNIGDQYSDLVGASSGAGSFLLPNPFYALL